MLECVSLQRNCLQVLGGKGRGCRQKGPRCLLDSGFAEMSGGRGDRLGMKVTYLVLTCKVGDAFDSITLGP